MLKDPKNPKNLPPFLQPLPPSTYLPHLSEGLIALLLKHSLPGFPTSYPPRCLIPAFSGEPKSGLFPLCQPTRPPPPSVTPPHLLEAFVQIWMETLFLDHSCAHRLCYPLTVAPGQPTTGPLSMPPPIQPLPPSVFSPHLSEKFYLALEGDPLSSHLPLLPTSQPLSRCCWPCHSRAISYLLAIPNTATPSLPVLHSRQLCCAPAKGLNFILNPLHLTSPPLCRTCHGAHSSAIIVPLTIPYPPTFYPPSTTPICNPYPTAGAPISLLTFPLSSPPPLTGCSCQLQARQLPTLPFTLRTLPPSSSSPSFGGQPYLPDRDTLLVHLSSPPSFITRTHCSPQPLYRAAFSSQNMGFGLVAEKQNKIEGV